MNLYKQQIIFWLQNYLNPLKNKKLFDIIPIIYGCIIALLYNSMYQSSDDWDMRVVLEGSAGGIQHAPSNFSMYMTVIYGNILKFFYSVCPKLSWYDLFQTLFVIISIYVSTLFLGKNFTIKSNLYKVLSLIVASNVAAIALLSPQFTITSGILGVSSAFAFFIIVDNYYKKTLYNILCGLYCILALFFGTLIRSHSCWIGAFYTGLLLLPFLPYKKIKTLLLQSLIPLIGVCIALTTYLYNEALIKKDPIWNEGIQKNIARVSIQDNTDAWNHPSEMWLNLEDKLDEISQKDFSFSKADYRMLLAAIYLGDPEIYSASNLKKVSQKLSPLVSIKDTKMPSFRVGDYRLNFNNFLILFIVLALVTKKRISLYFALCFFLIIVGLNSMFRDTPYRVWYIFVFSTFFVELKFAFQDYVNNKKYQIIAYLIIFSILAFLPLKKQINYQNFSGENYTDIKRGLHFLDKDKKYIIDYAFKEAFGRPFSKNIFAKKGIQFIDTSPLNHFYIYQQGMNKDFWLSVCNNDNIEYLTHKRIYGAPLIQYKKALSYFIKEKYGKNVVWIQKHPTPNLITYQCKIISDKELSIVKKYKELSRDLAYSDNNKLFYLHTQLALEIAKIYLGKELNTIRLMDFLRILNSEIVLEEKNLII